MNPTQTALDLIAAMSSEIAKTDAHMAAIGKKGGKIGGPARAKNLSAKRRSQIAIMGAEARWRPKHSLKVAKAREKMRQRWGPELRKKIREQERLAEEEAAAAKKG